MKSLPFLLIALVVISPTACSDQQVITRAPKLERVMVEWEPDVLWRRGGMEDDTVLYGPWAVSGAGNHAVVLDWGGQRIRSFDLLSGHVRWSFGTRGEGPGEFENPTDIVLLRDGRTLVWDPQVGRLTWISEDGRLDAMVYPDPLWRPRGFCELADGSLVALQESVDSALVKLGDEGAFQVLDELPWSELADLEPIQRQAEFVGGSDGTCIYVLTQSTGFARADSNGFGVRGYYVEPMRPPEVEVRETRSSRSTRLVGEYQMAVRAAFVREGELWLAFHGESESAGRLIDVFDARTGQYERSYEIPWSVSGLGAAGDAMLFLSSSDGYPLLYAVRAPWAARGGAETAEGR